MVDIISSVRIRAETEGFDRAARDLDGLSRSQLSAINGLEGYTRRLDPLARALVDVSRGEELIRRAREQGLQVTSAATRALETARQRYDDLTRAMRENANVPRGRGADIEAYGKQLDDLRAKYNPVFAAGRQYRDTLAEITNAAKVGAISERERVAALDRTKTAFVEQIRVIRDHAEVTGNSRMQMMMLQSALSNTASSLGSGASISQVVMQQAPDLFQAFGGGGLKSALKGIKDSLLEVVTPSRLAAGALGAVGLAAASSFYRAYEAQRALTATMIGAGRGTGLTLGGLNAAAMQGAAASGGHLSISAAREAVGTFASSGLVDRSIIGGAVGSVERFSRISGQDIPDAAKSLASAFADPSKGAEELNKSLGFLNDRLAQTIKNLQESGDVVGAQKTLMDAFKQSVDAATPAIEKNRGAWDKLWGAIKTGVSNADSAVGGAMGGYNREQQLSFLRDSLATAKQGLGGSGIRQEVLSTYPARIAELERQIADERKAAEDAKKEVANNRLSISAAANVRKYSPEQSSLQEIINARDMLRKIGDNADALKDAGFSAEQYATALRRAETAAATYETAIQKVANDSALAARQTMAYTFAEREAVAVDSARINAIRSSKDILVAAAEAEKTRVQLIAEGNAKARDYARQSSDELKLAGLRPYERARQQVLLDTKNFRDQYVPGASGPETPVVSGFQRVGSAAELLAGTLSGAAAKIGGGGVGISAGGASLAAFTAAGMNGSSSTVADFIQKAASARGIDPATALRVARSEGLNSYVGDNGSSFGPFMLHYGGIAKGGNAVSGLGDEFTRITGLDARNPLTVFQQSEFALDYAKKNGWGAFHGAARAGIGTWDGINGGSVTPEKVAQIKSTAMADRQRGDNDRLAAIDIDQIRGPFVSATDSIMEMSRQTDLLRATFGKSAEEIAAANDVEKLRTQYLRAGIDETTLSGDALKKFNEYLAETGRRSLQVNRAKIAEEDRQQNVMGSYDLVRSSASDIMSSPLKAMMRGQNAGDAMREAVLRMNDKMFDKGVDLLMKSLLGKPGEMGGLLGGGLGDLLGGLWPFANGGIMSASGSIPLKRYASGGVANSPQMAIFGEGSMNEAYVPLPDGRSIPVAMRGGGGGASNVTVNHQIINNAPGVEVQTKATRQPNGHVQMQTMIHQAIAHDIASNGPTARMLQNTYGMSRSTGRV
ncbi:Prophage tail length tape measure protein [Rhodoblastus acidophilus]|uniref:Prophage tail length tape measure protein n=1 Tax=Rhodoblastus acidophilus TaxID=1074 RepID=A0A212SE39_RHOAC|nr:phage tail length tape measure family protein [Rhodoblastus acidophilus]PPQ34973.1 hypothetical protein CKO16_21425 [Rhodoblastus acidophilus]RAI16817.1 hypothetical protein CH337_19465 [Rhodoblastus acidophilus]SNB83812.1 Prophage tail length tape measure protein [Rhodoblastus acidophilus]